MAIELFPNEEIVGIFRGFRDGGLEFHADLVLPYRNNFQSIPMHGQFLLVQLETKNEAVLGRITSFSSEGKLSSTQGEDFNIRAVQEERTVPEDLREQYLRYRVNIRVLGILRSNINNKKGSAITFVPSHRRLPHVGSKVAFASKDVLEEIAGHHVDGSPIGFFALGEYIYSGNNEQFEKKEWMQIKEPEILVKFPISNLVSRRSFIFARAGFGKSNLNKLLFSELYRQSPVVKKRGGVEVPVGTIIFDPDGEYFWPDDKGRPGLCDVKHLQDKLVVFTPRDAPSYFYRSFVADGVKLDLRQLKPSDVISIAIPPERQNQQNISKLKTLSKEKWERLVNLVDTLGNLAPLEDIASIIGIDSGKQEAETIAARSNMTAIVKSLHDKSSQLLNKLFLSLEMGKLCVIDISHMRGQQSLILAGLILRLIFDKNQKEFTSANPKTIPTIAVIEEAQSVLNENGTGSGPFIEWVKEGRKYDLGALLITQQPGSIPVEILSQGDNWFIFHLLSSADLMSLKKANAHFSDDLLSSLLNEPIAGQGVFWSSVWEHPYPIAIRALSFEAIYKVQDPKYNLGEVRTFAYDLWKTIDQANTSLLEDRNFEMVIYSQEVDEAGDIIDVEPTIDYLEVAKQRAIQEFKTVYKDNEEIRVNGFLWGRVKGILLKHLPNHIINRDDIAYNLVEEAMNQTFGPRNKKWESLKKQTESTGKINTYVLVIDKS